jgi:non-specific serine/threonine protein kinase
LGDTFRDSKYKVLRKLGYGSSSTVWLAISTGYVSAAILPLFSQALSKFGISSSNQKCNLSIPKYVALKIMTAKASSTNKELSFLDHLSKQGHGDPGAQHLTVLLDTFSHHGPNGTHLCFVFEPMATTATDLVEELPENQPLMYGKPLRYPKWIAKKNHAPCSARPRLFT